MNTNHQRHSIRLKGYEYSQPGGYFVTLVTHEKEYLFGNIVGGKMKVNEFGEIAHKHWLQIPAMFGFVELGEFVIMPNHIHVILIIHESVGAGFTPAQVDEIEQTNSGQPQIGQPQIGQPQIGQPQFGQPRGLPLRGTYDIWEPRGLPRRVTVGNIVGVYKSLVANECLKIFKNRNEVMGKLWQRNYYERIIRSERELNQIGEYIISNPANWDSDSENAEIS